MKKGLVLVVEAIFLMILFASLTCGYSWPVKGDHPIHATLGEWRDHGFHRGIDISKAENTEVYSVNTGTVGNVYITTTSDDSYIEIENFHLTPHK